MKTAFPYWRQRIAPVFDTTRQILIVEKGEGMTLSRTQELLPDTHPAGKVLRLVELEIESLVCGALSRQVRQMATSCGIRVVPFIAGDLDEIVRSWVAGKLAGDAHAMPGCRRRRRRGSTDAFTQLAAPDGLNPQNEPEDRYRNEQHGRRSACQAAIRRRKI
ncbi:MAG: NifB/NifX family molybdenum-iron cluster-binding protein [Desulfoprunum sp.]